jgi:phage/plasmid-like protein (TIGR03299 family)
MPTLTSFASRQPATYICGTVKPEGWKSTDEAMKDAHLTGWNVRLRPLDSDARRTKETFEVVRDNPFDGGLDRLGTSGERYGEVQNEDVFGMFADLNPIWEAMGQFRGGALVYGQAKTDQSILIDPNGVADEIQPMVVVSTTHDGSGALRIGRTAMRLDCLNQFNAMFGNLQHAISIRHTLTIKDRMKKIRLAWKQNNAYFDALSAEANALFQKSCTDNQFFAIVESIMGERPDANVKGAQTKYDNSLEMYAEAWKGEPNAKVRGTAWGAYQALIERNQWGRTIQNTTNGVENFAMAGMGFDIPTNTFRQRSLDLVRSI